MATAAYILGRKKYQRPQAVLWAENSGTLTYIDPQDPTQGSIYVPNGQEIGAVGTLTAGGADQFLILSDHNRGEISVTPERIERRQRTINGRMRSYHIADKLKFSWSWDNIPSRAYYSAPEFNADGVSPYKGQTGEFTADGGAGGVDILDWYENHKGSFWMYLAYDKRDNFGDNAAAYGHLAQYNQVVEVMFSDFSYNIVKRGGMTHDLWNISVSLEEV